MLLHQVETNEILRLVRDRMQRDGLSQRALARLMQVSQGHLSKVLRAQFPSNTRVMSMLKDWATGESTAPRSLGEVEATLLQAARMAADGSDRVMQLLTEMMHHVDQARRVRRRRKAGGEV
jgi:transcriptional regulator with XRE-family HTH domain